ncbi:hypothetical protein [Streptomyces corynorhini]|uniref:hypothetical protein n=1 Tax=Streptomyces corynorhini TaxID=2282652 RepID=UPI0013143451|nr:hypothetical protein [Streptomyces corynorhini]
MLSNSTLSRCDRCGDSIRWTLTDKNRLRQAVNPEPDPAGTRAVWTTVTGTVMSRALDRDRPQLEGAEWQARVHVSTCGNPPPRRSTGSGRRQRAGVRPQPWRWAR